MIVRRYAGNSIRAFVIVLCFKNWILCAPSGSASVADQSQDQLDIHSADPSIDVSSTPSHTTVVKLPKVNRNNRNGRIKNVTQGQDNAPESQNFFQSFAPLFGNNSPLGHSRPLLYPEHSFKPAFKTASYRELPFASGPSDNILGSGNFGVVKGGTYYAEEREADDFSADADNEPYTYLGSSHSRVYKKNPPPAFRNGGDFFAHFRDFADITAPSKSYSQYYVVYVNKNATIEDSSPARTKQPNNIIEQLTMLDEEPLTAHESTKQSKFKKKLAAHQSRDQQKEKSIKMKLFDSPKEITEPLLALS